MELQRVAELGYSEKYRKVEIAVPHGMPSAELAKVSERLFSDFLSQLPRACESCMSGHSFIIRERLEYVLQVDLDRMEIVGQI